jgi:large subunit ribosomal protein L29
VKAQKIREMSAEELRAKEKELEEKLFRMRLQKAVGQLDNAGKIRATRREIARTKTILKEKNA